jgi:hypothetical protein
MQNFRENLQLLQLLKQIFPQFSLISFKSLSFFVCIFHLDDNNIVKQEQSFFCKTPLIWFHTNTFVNDF